MKVALLRMSAAAALILLTGTIASPTEAWAQSDSNRSTRELWRALRNALTAEGGENYFAQIKGALIPPEGMFQGTVVSQSSQTNLIINVDNAADDATLEFDHPLKDIVPGTLVLFRGVVKSYTKEPWMLRLSVDDDDVRGLAY